MRAARLVFVAVLLSGLVSCGSGSADGSGDDGDVTSDATAAGRELEQQRTDVRDAATTLLRGAERALAGSVATGTGSWRGCESTFNDQHKNFQYLAQGRVHATSGRPYLDSLRSMLEDAGFAVGDEGDRPGGRTLSASKGQLSATFSEMPDQGDFVLLTVAGPCVDVPEDQRDDWERKADPSPTLL
jgi:hypothetical protein